MADRISLDELASRTGEAVERLRDWQRLGLLGDDAARGFAPRDVERVRLIAFAERRGFAAEELARISAAQGDIFAWFIDQLASTATWILPKESIEKFGDLKKPEAVIGTGPWMLDRYDAGTKLLYSRNPSYFIAGQPYAEACVCHLVEPLGLAQPTVSHHTKALAEAGLIVGEKRGRWVYWRVVAERVDALRRTLEPLGYMSSGG